MKSCEHILFLKVIQNGPQMGTSNLLTSVCSFLMFVLQRITFCHFLHFEITSLLAGRAAPGRFIPRWCLELGLSARASRDPSGALGWAAGRQPCKPRAAPAIALKERVREVFVGG